MLKEQLKKAEKERDDSKRQQEAMSNQIKDFLGKFNPLESDAAEDTTNNGAPPSDVASVVIVTPESEKKMPSKKRDYSKDKIWTKAEMRKLLIATHRIGKNEYGKYQWKEIANELPGVTNIQAAGKWQMANQARFSNCLEEAFVGEKVVSMLTASTSRTGTVKSYEMNQDDRVGTWTIEYEDGTTKLMEKDELLAAWRLSNYID